MPYHTYSVGCGWDILPPILCCTCSLPKRRGLRRRGSLSTLGVPYGVVDVITIVCTFGCKCQVIAIRERHRMVRGWRYARPSLAIIVPLLFMSSVYAINLISISISHDIAMHSNLVPCASLLPTYPFCTFLFFFPLFLSFLFGFCCYDLELCTCFSDIFRIDNRVYYCVCYG